jgi:hypothetical protein
MTSVNAQHEALLDELLKDYERSAQRLNYFYTE